MKNEVKYREMAQKLLQPGCVIHGRVSTSKQSQYGESMEDQELIGRRIAESKNAIVLPNNQIWLESFSGRKNKRPVFEDILSYIKDNPGKVQYYIFSVIDRFTRAGAFEYARMKQELAELGVEMIDSRGVIQPPQNTLEHLGVKYDWSVTRPSEINEITTATKAQQEVTDILTRMIGAEIRLMRQGYQVGSPDDGYQNEKIFIDGKKKTIQVPNPERAKYFIRMFELRASGLYDDPEIVDKLNAEGFKTKVRIRWNQNHTKAIGSTGGLPLSVKQLQRVIIKPIYAGVICETWTSHLPVRAQYKGLVSIETFNKATRGKVFIKENTDDTLEILYNYNPNRTKRKNKNNPLFPYKFIRCPLCCKPLTGSASKGKSGKGFPGYHCSRKHRYFRVKKSELENTVNDFFGNLKFTPDYLSSLEASLINKYREKEQEVSSSSSDVSRHISDLEGEKSATINAFIQTQNQSIRIMLETKIEELDSKLKEVKGKRSQIEITEDDIGAFIKDAKHLMEHPGEILMNQTSPQARESLLGLFFEEIPTYFDITDGTPRLTWIFELSKPNQTRESLLVALRGIEPRFKP
jgi:site-specific DNA recombinase